MGANKKFYIADLHFGHKNSIKYDDRPFDSVDEMDAELVKRWNETVGPGDIVYVLGDMFWQPPKRAIETIRKLHGQKFLILGNHDAIGNKD